MGTCPGRPHLIHLCPSSRLQHSNVVVNAKQNQSQVMHTADVLYFNVIHTDQLLTHEFLPFLDLARGLWTRGWVGWLALHTGRSSMLSRLKLVTFQVAGWLILREKYFVSKGGGSSGGGGGSNCSRRGPS